MLPSGSLRLVDTRTCSGVRQLLIVGPSERSRERKKIYMEGVFGVKHHIVQDQQKGSNISIYLRHDQTRLDLL